MGFYDLNYGKFNPWIATLGSTPKQIDPITGKEDFTEYDQVSTYIEMWRPGQPWIPQKICLHFKARGRKCYKTDRIFNGLIGPFISANAVDKMRPLLEKEGHVLPLDVVNSDEKFFLWWVPVVVDSVDAKASETFPNDRTIKKYALNKGKVRSLTAFRPYLAETYKPEHQGIVLVSDEFKETWLDAKLTGIEFTPASLPFSHDA